MKGIETQRRKRNMKFEDLIRLYEEKKKRYGEETYKHISELLKEAKELHKRDWLKKPTPNKASKNWSAKKLLLMEI